MQEGNFLWASKEQSFAAETANCSLLASQGDSFYHNCAEAAGAIIFSTDLATTKLSCASNIDQVSIMNFNWSVDKPNCSAWQGNMVSSAGYGPELAFVPATLSLPEVPALGSYVSNDSNQIAMMIQVQDQAGTQVTPGLCPCLCMRRDVCTAGMCV